MRKLAPIFALLVCIWLGFSRPIHRTHRESPAATPTVETAGAPTAPEPTPQQPIVAPPAKVDAIAVTEPTMLQHVFLLQLDRGLCTLEKIGEVRGAFGRERRQQWQPGMLCCRLIAEDGSIVGEKTMPAPDHVCVVLDPNDSSGTPAAARLTSEGPAVFQVRFPDISGAVRLEVHRIATDSRPAAAAAPIGQLIASLEIPGK